MEIQTLVQTDRHIGHAHTLTAVMREMGRARLNGMGVVEEGGSGRGSTTKENKETVK